MPDIALRFRARMLRIDTKSLVGGPRADLRRRNCGTWDHHVRGRPSFTPGLRQTGGGDGVARLRARENMRSYEPAESLGLDRGPVVTSRTLTAIRDRDLQNLFDELGI